MYLVNDDVIHILSNDDNFVFYYQKKIEEKKLEGGKERWAWEWGFFLEFTTENDEIGIFVYKEKYVKK